MYVYHQPELENKPDFCLWRRKSAEMIKKWDLPGSGSTSAEFGAHFQRTNFSRPFISVLSPALDFKPFGSQTLRDVLSTPLPSILDSSVTLFVTLFSKGSNTRLDFVLLLKKTIFFAQSLSFKCALCYANGFACGGENQLK